MTYEEYYELAENYYINHNYEEAIGLFKEALKLEETNDCLNYIGCCYSELNDFKAAGKIFFKLSDDNPDWERPVFNLGRTLLKSGYIEEALIAFKEAERRNPDNDEVYFYLGTYYYKIKDYINAKDCYEKSISINDNDEQAITHNNLGVCYRRLGMKDKAIQEFDIAYKYDKNYVDAIYNKGVTLVIMRKYKEALDNLFVVYNLNSNDLEVMMHIAYVFYKTKDLQTAVTWINKVLTIEPQHEWANKLLKQIINLQQDIGDV